MNTAFVVFDRMTALDFVGAYDPLTRLRSMGFMPEFRWEVCAFTPQVSDDRGLKFTPDSVARPLADYDLVLIPGGVDIQELQRDGAFIDWLRSAASAELKASVCTGSLLLGAAGFMAGRRATSHPSAFEQLAAYGAEVLDHRVVDDGDLVTSRGVTAGIDLGLHLVDRIAGEETRNRISTQMDYPYGKAAIRTGEAG